MNQAILDNMTRDELERHGYATGTLPPHILRALAIDPITEGEAILLDGAKAHLASASLAITELHADASAHGLDLDPVGRRIETARFALQKITGGGR